MSADDKMAYHDVLEADENGHTPDSSAFNEKSQSSIEIIGKHDLEARELKIHLCSTFVARICKTHISIHFG